MGNTIVALVTLAYVIGIVGYLWKGNYAQALMLFGYSIANVGLILTTKD